MNELEIIRSSFEKWYNTHVNTSDKRVSVITNYSDEQTLSIKAYHKTTITLAVVGIRDNMSYINTLFNLTSNYNHGVTTEEEARLNSIKSLLSSIFDYCGAN